MDCEKFLENIDNYTDGLLSEADKALMDAHADICPECRSELEFALSIAQTLHDIPPLTVPSDFAEKLNARLDIEETIRIRGKSRKTRIMRGFRMAAPLAACLVLAVVLAQGPFDLVSDMPSRTSDSVTDGLTDADVPTADRQSENDEVQSGENTESTPVQSNAEESAPVTSAESATAAATSAPKATATAAAATTAPRAAVSASPAPTADAKAAAAEKVIAAARAMQSADVQSADVQSEPVTEAADTAVVFAMPDDTSEESADLIADTMDSIVAYAPEEPVENTEKARTPMGSRMRGYPGEPGTGEKITASEVVDELDHSELGAFIPDDTAAVTAQADTADLQTETTANGMTLDKSKCREASVDIDSAYEERVKEILGSYDVVEEKHSAYYMSPQDYESFIKSLQREGIPYISSANQDSHDKTVFLRLYAIVS